MDRKRLLDLALLLPSAPFFFTLTAGLAAAVLILDGRPVVFVQHRVGRGRRAFRIFKLRTMTTEPDPSARRVTRVGRWMRQRGVDELPQLLNVLRGDMSLVGPRPLTPADADRLVEHCQAFGDRFRQRPGLTGPAQVQGTVGAQAVAEVEAAYARTASARDDVRILLTTLVMNAVGKRRGRELVQALSTPGRGASGYRRR